MFPQIWDCFDYDITVTKKKKCYSIVSFLARIRKCTKESTYFTIDNAPREKGVIDTNFSEYDPRTQPI